MSTINHHPSAASAAINAQYRGTQAGGHQVNILGKAMEVAVIEARGNDQGITNMPTRLKIENSNIFCFFLVKQGHKLGHHAFKLATVEVW